MQCNGRKVVYLFMFITKTITIQNNYKVPLIIVWKCLIQYFIRRVLQLLWRQEPVVLWWLIGQEPQPLLPLPVLCQDGS